MPSYPDAAPYFPIKDAGSEATKKGVAWGLGTGAVSYALMKGFESLVARELRLTPTGVDLAVSALLGTALGAAHGHNTKKFTQISNMQANLLNKYADTPAIQAEIFADVGVPGSFKYERTAPEKAFGLANTASLIGWVLTPPRSRLHNAMFASTALTAVGDYTAHIMGMNHAEHAMREKLSHVDRVASERKAALTGAQTLT